MSGPDRPSKPSLPELPLMDMSNTSMDFAGLGSLPSMPPLTPLAALGSSGLTPGTLPLLVQMPDGSRRQVELSPNATVNDLRAQLGALDDWVLNFNSEILDNSLPLNRYNIPDAYDHAGGLLKMIDTSELPLDQRLDALDKACSVVSGISRGERDVDRIIKSALSDRLGNQDSLQALPKRIPESSSGIPLAPPTPSLLIRRLGVERPDLYPPRAADKMIAELSRLGTPRTINAAVKAAVNAEAAGLVGAGARLVVDAAASVAGAKSAEEQRKRTPVPANHDNPSPNSQQRSSEMKPATFIEKAPATSVDGDVRQGSRLSSGRDMMSRKVADEGNSTDEAFHNRSDYDVGSSREEKIDRENTDSHHANTWFDDVMKSLLPEPAENGDALHAVDASDEDIGSYDSSEEEDNDTSACYDGDTGDNGNSDNCNVKELENCNDGDNCVNHESTSNSGRQQNNFSGSSAEDKLGSGPGSSKSDGCTASMSALHQPAKVPKKRGRKRKHPELTEEQRRALRQAQNRESAKQSRLRRKTIAADYEQRVSTLSTENDSLRKTITALGDRLQFLQGMLTVSVTQRHPGAPGVPLPSAPPHPVHFAMPMQAMPVMQMSAPNGMPIPMISAMPMDQASAASGMSSSMGIPMTMFPSISMNPSAAPSTSTSADGSSNHLPKI